MSRLEIPEGLQTKVCALGENALAEIPAVVKELWPGKEAVLIADENTWEAAGKQVEAILKAAGICVAAVKVYPRHPVMHADYDYIPELAAFVKGRLPIVIGSGTLNDLTKRSSFESQCGGYMCVATACSVDGYTSYGAAISVNKFKQTLQCDAPLAIIADSAVLSSAPADMTASGYADLAAKVVAGADWYIADAVGATPMDARAWNMVHTHLDKWLESPEELAKNSPERLAALFSGLAYTGFAMQYYHDSRPASGAEHLFSHQWEMDGLVYKGEAPSHGFKVAIGTLISTAMMEYAFKVLSKAEVDQALANAPEVSVEERTALIDAYFKNSKIYENVRKVCLGKLLTGKALQQRRTLIREKWQLIGDKVLGKIYPYQEMERRFLCLNCPIKAQDIGLDETELRRGMVGACMIRARYTIMDFLFEGGLYQQAMDYAVSKVLRA